MFRLGYCLIAVILLGVFFEYSSAKCSLDIQKDLPPSDPVFVDKNHNLLKPTGRLIEWNVGDKFGVICSGNNNALISTNQRASTIECRHDGLHANGQYVSQLQCARDIVADTLDTNRACIGGGTLKHVGFRSLGSNFTKYLEVCYNMNSASVVYTHHIIPGKSINYRVQKALRPYFNAAGAPSKAQVSKMYLRKQQTKTFTKLLGSEQYTRYFNVSSFLSRGHLSPDADGVFKSWQLATYFYINVAPQWLSTNSGNWLAVEKLARRKAAKINDDLEIYTGVSGIMSLPDSSGRNVKLYLKNGPTGNFIPTPLWYWKVLKYKDEGIAFLSMNNPFANQKLYLCPDICQNYNWPNKGFDNFHRGFTYCCKVSDLIKVLPEVPPEVLVTRVMKY